MGTYFETEGKDEWVVRYMKEMFAEDSVYSEGSRVLITDTTSEVRFLNDIRSDFKRGVYLADGAPLAIGKDTLHINQISDSKILLIRPFTDSIWNENHFHRLPDSVLDRDESKSTFPKPGAHIELSVSDTLDRNYHLDFIDNRQVIITGLKEGMPYTVLGTWHSKWVDNTLFFSFFDNHFEQMELYFFYGDSAGKLIGGAFNNAGVLGAEPPQLLTNLTDVNGIDRFEMIKSDIIGEWKAINEPLFYDPAIEFGFLSYQSFEITFDNDGSFRMIKSGTVLKRGDSIPLEEETKGNWEVGPMGRYIELTPTDGIPFYFSIEKVSAQEMVVYCLLKTISEFPNYNVYENRKIVLRK